MKKITSNILRGCIGPTPWTYRLIVLNSLVFLLMTFIGWSSGHFSAIFFPSHDLLLSFGAKDPVQIALGEYWRFVTPIFVHIGIIHFLLNTLGLYYIGAHIEKSIGSFWFLLIYLVAGTAGNIASHMSNIAVSAGASGSLFGLLGAGYALERLIGKKVEELTGARPPRGSFLSLVLINVGFGFVVPGIDNAAHLGGLVSGIVLTYTMVQLRPNRLLDVNPAKAYLLVSLLVGAMVAGVVSSVDPQKTALRFLEVTEKSTLPAERYFFLSRALELEPQNPFFLVRRGGEALEFGDYKAGIYDFREAASYMQEPTPEIQEYLRTLKARLQKDNKQNELKILDSFTK